MKDTLKRWAAGVLAAVMLCGPRQLAGRVRGGCH